MTENQSQTQKLQQQARQVADDVTARAKATLERIADRMPELPKPVLAAIGAADLAGKQLTEFLNRLGAKSGGGNIISGLKVPPVPNREQRDEIVDDLRQTATDLPGKLQQVAADLPERARELVAELPHRAREFADQIEQFATQLPGKVQRFTEDLPEKAREVSGQLQPDQLKSSAEAYGQLVGNVFDTLADRGGKAWDELRNTGPVAGTVVEGGQATADGKGDATCSSAATAAPRVSRPARRRPSTTTTTRSGEAAKTAGKSATGRTAARAAAKPAPKTAPKAAGSKPSTRATKRPDATA